jgi:glycosyltransferase involved in cell wall biosynthesis
VANRPLKIIYVINRLNVGGASHHVITLAAGLTAKGFETTIVTGRSIAAEGDISEYARDRGVRLIVMPSMDRSRGVLSPFKDLWTVVALWRLFRRERPDIVHTHTAIGGALGRVAAWLARVPVRVHTFHGNILSGYYVKPLELAFRLVEQALARITTRLIVPTEFQASEMADEFKVAPALKFAVVGLGMDLTLFQQEQEAGAFKREAGIDTDGPLVGIVGRLAPIKNVPRFLEAAKRVLDAKPDVRFAIVGDGPDREALERLSMERGLANKVQFCGWVANIGPVLRDLAVLALSSDNEGTPVTIIEAMAAGVPIVATSVGGVPTMLMDGAAGRLVQPGDAGQLADGILAAIDDHDATDRMCAAATASLGRYSETTMVEVIAALYEESVAAVTPH